MRTQTLTKGLFWMVGLLAATSVNVGFAAEPVGVELGPAPRGMVYETPGYVGFRAPAAVSFNPMNRAQVAQAFQNVYLPQTSVPMGWSGNVSSCNAGSNSAAYRQATIDRVNFYRASAGLPGNIVLYGGSQTAATQDAALMFSANEALDHFPPPSWLCWTSSGDLAAGNSNIAISWGSDVAAGPRAVDLYMDDSGTGNSAVGHRRWILYPPQVMMESGSIPIGSQPASNALWVIGSFGPRPVTPNGVAWPPRGYVPWQILPAVSNRWSFSWPGANFSAATVSMKRDGVSLGASAYEALANGYGDNTLVWRPAGVSYSQPLDGDVRYTVTISGISGSGVPSTISYDVIVIDPFTTDGLIFANGFE